MLGGSRQMKMNKCNSWVLSVTLSLALVAFPSSDSEAQSAEMPLSELSCQKLNTLSLDKMGLKQRAYAGQCDVAEASQAWEQSYGALSHDDWAAGVVYE